jgi:molybdopterin synthase catalytic subunit
MHSRYQCLISSQQISTTQALPFIAASEHGAMCHFVGVVRDNNHGKAVLAIDYEVCEPLASTILKQIAEEAIQRFPRLKVYVAHYVGYLEVGHVSMLVSTSTPHRDDAYQSNRFIVEAIKHRCPIWKKEYYTDTSVAWVKGCKIQHEHLS